MTDKPMPAFHSFWTVPYRIRHNGSVQMTDFELLTLVLSALTWQKYNGPMRMITDDCGRNYFLSLGLGNLWSDGISTSLNGMPEVDPFVFWAAGKLHALAAVHGPAVMIDTDLIIWRDIRDRLDCDVTAAHPERLDSPVYPDPHLFELRGQWRMPASWNLAVHPVNTAFLCVRDDQLRYSYVEAAFEFMQDMTEAKAYLEPTIGMCFAEQRILPMHAAARGASVSYLFQPRDMFSQQLVTHIWGFKKALSESAEIRHNFCKTCLARLGSDYPDWLEIVQRIPSVGQYRDWV